MTYDFVARLSQIGHSTRDLSSHLQFEILFWRQIWSPHLRSSLIENITHVTVEEQINNDQTLIRLILYVDKVVKDCTKI